MVSTKHSAKPIQVSPGRMPHSRDPSPPRSPRPSRMSSTESPSCILASTRTAPANRKTGECSNRTDYQPSPPATALGDHHLLLAVNRALEKKLVPGPAATKS
ncbi:unnamed protein product [Prorocentrum cordatum]|uniref:Uncharacterized protein n=1 Tax=Prorocentrum cordatum TaxID=2364126 RepID=A0ABN9YAY2_9DINO|nr:unnamed protein product [Polarella glacialis]